MTWVGNVCAQCHTVMGGLFAKSVHAKVFAEIDRILGDQPFLPEGRPEQPPMPPPRKIFKE